MRTIIGLRREDKNIWERRVAISPKHAQILQQQYPLQFCVQPFRRRAFSDEEYKQAGVHSCEDLSCCQIIMGIKEIPPPLILPEKVYIFFSHTIKGQAYNMPMLQKIIDNRCTLIDYECIKDAQGRRLVFFGGFAGMAGMVETLHALGRRLQLRGYQTPFSHIQPAHHYHDVAEVKAHLRQIGAELQQRGLPEAIRPLVFGFSGYGHVSKGAQEMFDLLPHKMVDPQELPSLANRSDALLFKVQFAEQHMVEPIDPSQPFDKWDYFQHPQKYRGIFERYLPYLHVLVNGIYWDERYPRLLTKAYLHQRFSFGPPLSLLVVGDISCDIHGAIECTEKVTTPDHPIFSYHPLTGKVIDGYDDEGLWIMAIDNLPAELPRDASEFFSESVYRFIPVIAAADWRKPFNKIDLPAEIKNAIIVHNGRLTPNFSYLDKYLPNQQGAKV